MVPFIQCGIRQVINEWGTRSIGGTTEVAITLPLKPTAIKSIVSTPRIGGISDFIRIKSTYSGNIASAIVDVSGAWINWEIKAN